MAIYSSSFFGAAYIFMGLLKIAAVAIASFILVPILLNVVSRSHSIIAEPLLRFLISDYNPINFFYSALRAPLRAFNNRLEAALINNISNDNADRLKNFLIAYYSVQCLVGIVGVSTLVISR